MTAPIPLTQPVPKPLRRFGKYYLVQKLAEGGMAEIFLAKQIGAEGFERDVVVKCMLEHFTSSREFVEMFLDEARLAARLFHPNIVQITDLGATDGRYFICMEYLPGEDLQGIINASKRKGEPVPVAIAAKIILSACDGLEFAHEYQEGGKPANLVHRDVTPSNIIVTYQGQVKVLDFGIAKASSKFVRTEPGTVKGKLGYMSPEQGRGDALDARSDLFSLGITFHELLTGRRVFQKDNEVAVLMAMMHEPIPPPSQVRPELPAGIDAIVMRALEKDPANRYPSAAAMRQDIEKFLAGGVSSPGMSHLAAFMQHLFGAEQAARKTQVPTLKELAAQGFVVPPDLGSDPVTGFERTLVRKPEAASEQLPAHGPATQEIAPFPAEKKGSKALWVLGTIAVLALAGAGGVYAAWARGYPIPLLSPKHEELAVVTPQPEPLPPPLPPTAAEPKTEPATPPTTPTTPTEAAAQPEEKQPEETAQPEEVRPKKHERAVVLGLKDVSAAMSRRKAGITGCGETHRTDLPADGRLMMRVRVEHSGAMAAQVMTEAAEKTALGACLVKQFQSMKLPRNSNEPPLTGDIPLKFNER